MGLKVLFRYMKRKELPEEEYNENLTCETNKWGQVKQTGIYVGNGS